MRVVFMGTPSYARVVLECLCESSHEVVGVFTRQDAVSKRGNKKIPSEVKAFACERGIPTIEPASLKVASVQDQIATWRADVICVAAYGKILPKEILDMPEHWCLNVHASLLPRWRGAAPIERAILAGDAAQGVSIMNMEEGLDTGDFCAQAKIDAHGKTTCEITNELAMLGGKLLVDCLDNIDALKWVAQDDSLVTYAKKIEKNELFLCPEDPSELNYRRILASSDSHPAKCKIAGRTVRVLKASLTQSEEQDSRSVLWQDKKLFLAGLQILRLKPDGKNEMDAASFVAGCKEIREGNARWEAAK